MLKLTVVALLLVASASLAADAVDVTVYSRASPPPAKCLKGGPIQYVLTVKKGSPDNTVPLGKLKARVVESCKAEAQKVGANALLITDWTEGDFAGGFEMTCAGFAYTCPKK
jgi:type 1 fimbria pilin